MTKRITVRNGMYYVADEQNGKISIPKGAQGHAYRQQAEEEIARMGTAVEVPPATLPREEASAEVPPETADQPDDEVEGSGGEESDSESDNSSEDEPDPAPAAPASPDLVAGDLSSKPPQQ